MPMSCTVTETLNGEWELTLVHDIDERGKWTQLSEGCILRAPVPAAMTPSVDLVTQQYQTSQMNETLSTLAEQSENNFTWTVTKVNEIIEDAAASDNLTREQLNLIHTYMRFGEDGLTIGKAGNPLTFRVVNDRLAFYMNDTEVAYLSDNKLYVTQAEILARLQIGKFAYEPQPNGNLSVIYTG